MKTLLLFVFLLSTVAHADPTSGRLRINAAQARFANATQPPMSDLADHTLDCIQLSDNSHAGYTFVQDIESIRTKTYASEGQTFRPTGRSLQDDDSSTAIHVDDDYMRAVTHEEIRKEASGKILINRVYRAIPEGGRAVQSDAIPESAPRSQTSAPSGAKISDTLICVILK